MELIKKLYGWKKDYIKKKEKFFINILQKKKYIKKKIKSSTIMYTCSW